MRRKKEASKVKQMYMYMYMSLLYTCTCMFICLGYGWVGYQIILFSFCFLKASVLCTCISMYAVHLGDHGVVEHADGAALHNTCVHTHLQDQIHTHTCTCTLYTHMYILYVYCTHILYMYIVHKQKLKPINEPHFSAFC